MNLRIRNSKDNLVNFTQNYLNELLSDVPVEFIVNGYKLVDTITAVGLDFIDEEYYLTFYFAKEEPQNVPLLEDTKANIGFQIVVIETKNHTTVIEVLD